MNLQCLASYCVAAGLFLSAARVEGQASCGPTFLHAASYPADIQFPQAAATGDFTGDGFIDIAVVGGYIGVLPGDGAGAFGLPILTPFSNSTHRTIAADLDDDGDLDLASGDSSVAIYLGNGDGTFEFAGSYDGGSNTTGFALGFFNEDAIPDLAQTFSFYDNGVAILLGYGDGTFQAPVLYTNGSPSSLAVADFNEDGRSDVAAPLETDAVALYLSQPDGTLPAPTLVTVGSDMRGSMAGDVDGDGFADLVVSRPDVLELLYGNGNGTFDAPVAIPVAGQPDPLFVLDVDDDGLDDLVINQPSDIGNLAILFQSAPGVFLPPAGYQPAHPASGFATGDFDGDDRADFASPSYSDEVVDVFLWQATGLAAAPFVRMRSDPGRVAAGDFDGDGVSEVVGRDGFEALAVTGRDTDGFFRTLGATTISVGSNVWSLAAADFNSDTLDDLAVAVDGGLRILLSDGDHTFSDGPPPPPLPEPVALVVAADFDGDGLADLVLERGFPGDGHIQFLRGSGDGTFQPPVEGPASEHSIADLIAVDLDGDSALDLASANGGACCGYSSNTVSVFLGNGDGTFQAPSDYAGGPGAASLAAADFDGDGHLDIVTANSETSNVSILAGDGSRRSRAAGVHRHRMVSGSRRRRGFQRRRFCRRSHRRRRRIERGAPTRLGAARRRARGVRRAGALPDVGPAHAHRRGPVRRNGSGRRRRLEFEQLRRPRHRLPAGHGAHGLRGFRPVLGSARRGRDAAGDGLGVRAAPVPVAAGRSPSLQRRRDRGRRNAGAHDCSGRIRRRRRVRRRRHRLLLQRHDFSGPARRRVHRRPGLVVIPDDILVIAAHGITSGCGAGNFCPTAPVRRDQMAVFLLKARYGSGYAPPPCGGTFADVACPGQYADWIEQLAAEGVTSGCGSGDYCPGQAVTRAQMATSCSRRRKARPIRLLPRPVSSATCPPARSGPTSSRSSMAETSRQVARPPLSSTVRAAPSRDNRWRPSW